MKSSAYTQYTGAYIMTSKYTLHSKQIGIWTRQITIHRHVHWTAMPFQQCYQLLTTDNTTSVLNTVLNI